MKQRKMFETHCNGMATATTMLVLRRQQFLSKGIFRYFQTPPVPVQFGNTFVPFWRICKLVGMHFRCGEKRAENSNLLIIMHYMHSLLSI